MTKRTCLRCKTPDSAPSEEEGGYQFCDACFEELENAGGSDLLETTEERLRARASQN